MMPNFIVRHSYIGIQKMSICMTKTINEKQRMRRISQNYQPKREWAVMGDFGLMTEKME